MDNWNNLFILLTMSSNDFDDYLSDADTYYSDYDDL